jgi:hypothetical protein
VRIATFFDQRFWTRCCTETTPTTKIFTKMYLQEMPGSHVATVQLYGKSGSVGIAPTLSCLRSPFSGFVMLWLVLPYAARTQLLCCQFLPRIEWLRDSRFHLSNVEQFTFLFSSPLFLISTTSLKPEAFELCQCLLLVCHAVRSGIKKS